MAMEIINLNINSVSQSYQIIIGDELLGKVQSLIECKLGKRKILLVSNSTIYPLFKDKLNINADILLLDDGEEFKNFDSYKKILDKAIELKLERNDIIVAFGGGVIGDVVGFAAASYLRGIKFVQIPTTLLAQIDSSVGGKVAINHAAGKNLIGAFYQPQLVIADLDTLYTLDNRQFKSGLAEMLKYAFIENNCSALKKYEFLDFLEKNSNKLLNLDKNVLIDAIKICCNLKAAVVNADEKEQNLRRILNFGHTFGHIFETATEYKRYTHGEAVALGMEISFNLSKIKKLITQEYYERVNNLLTKYELKLNFPKDLDILELLSIMKHDKKVENSKINFILATAPKEVAIVNNIKDIEIEELLKSYV